MIKEKEKEEKEQERHLKFGQTIGPGDSSKLFQPRDS
jgi:hypothetical protein